MTLATDDDLDVIESEQLPDDDQDTTADPESEIDPDDGDSVEVGFGDAAEDSESDEDETPVFTAMRKREREKDKELRKARREIEQLRQAQQVDQAPPTLDPKPTLESCKWDADLFEVSLDTWKEQAKAVDASKREAADKQQQQVVAAENVHKAYAAAAATLNQKAFKEAEAEVVAVLDVTRQSILLEAADNPAMLVYALGKNPAQLERLSKITSIVKFTAEIGKLEKEIKVYKQSEKPAPTNTNLRGSAAVSGGSTKRLAQLEAEAEKTGDRTKLVAYKKSLRK